MPKIKTRRTVTKRFRVTATGRLRRHRAAMSHYLGKRSQNRIRKNRKEAAVDSTNEKQILRLFGK